MLFRSRNFPSAIALPFMLGAGTITQAIFTGEHLPWLVGLLVILPGIVITFGILITFKLIGGHLKRVPGADSLPLSIFDGGAERIAHRCHFGPDGGVEHARDVGNPSLTTN